MPPRGGPPWACRSPGRRDRRHRQHPVRVVPLAAGRLGGSPPARVAPQPRPGDRVLQRRHDLVLRLSRATQPRPGRPPLLLGSRSFYDVASPGCTDGSLLAWDVATGRPSGSFRTGNVVPLRSLAVHPRAAPVVVAGGEGGTFWEWDSRAAPPRSLRFVSPAARGYWQTVQASQLLPAARMVPVFNENVGAVCFSTTGPCWPPPVKRGQTHPRSRAGPAR